MRRIAMHIGLVLYAAVLAGVQNLHHVRTDEAKYLLSIPYPHPPLVRDLFHSLDAFPFQECFWRFVLALLFVYAGLLAVRLLGERKPMIRAAVMGCWLLNLALILNAGSIMMASVTALQAWVFTYLYLRESERQNTGLIGLLWLASLFSAYQIVLFAPLVWVLLSRNRESLFRTSIAFFGPLFVLALYTVQNPLVIGSFLLHGNHQATLLMRLQDVTWLWLISGSIILSVVGLYGMLRYRQWAVVLSFLLVFGYVSLAAFGYYAPLFLPLSVAGLIAVVRRRVLSPVPVMIGVLVCSVASLLMSPPALISSPARQVMRTLEQQEYVRRSVLIAGDFGHEWQYESHVPLLRFNPTLLSLADAVVCVQACEDLPNLSTWRRLPDMLVSVWVRN